MREERDTFPLLLECDFVGRVLWMSNRTRRVLRNPGYLSDAIIGWKHRPHAVPGKSLRFWPVWESTASVLIGAQAEEDEPGETHALLGVERSLTGHFLELVRLERSLSGTVQRRYRRGGNRAVRQIELERLRLGRELHTGAAQTLAAIRLQLEIIAAELPSPPAIVETALSR